MLNCFPIEVHYYYSTGAAVQLPLQVVPQGIESVNGSNVTMGCATPVGTLPGTNVTICGSFGSGAGVISYLVDGNSPAIDTNISDWASQLVTVRKNDGTHDLQEHVLLTFGFDTAVSPTSIELDLFLCPDLNIGAQFITVFGVNGSNLVYSSASSNFVQSYTPNKVSCDSLSTVTFEDNIEGSSYHTWHIAVTFRMSDIEWVYVGEVRFMGIDVDSTPISSIYDFNYVVHVCTALAVWRN